MTVLADTNPPVCLGKSFIVTAIARNQSFPCGGCFYRPKMKVCTRPCKPSWFTRPFVNFKRVRDGETVRDFAGNLYTVHQLSKTRMSLLRKAKEL